MSDLETAAQPLLTPMILGRGRALHAAGQRTLAAWAFKTAAMFEWVHPDLVTIPQEHRDTLRSEHEPHRSCHVWLAAYSGTLHATYQQLGMTVTPSPTVPADFRDDSEAYAATLSIGHFVYQVASLTGFDIIRKGGMQTSIREIWPPDTGESFVWPPRPVLNTTELVAIHDSFRNT